MQTEYQELAHLLKTGQKEELAALKEQENKTHYPPEFVPFMDQILKEYKISRKQVAIRSGLSQDYVYKILRGDKHTTERDYILAICFAIGMTLSQTQHALGSYGMPSLSDRDLRSQIILCALQGRAGIDKLNEMLESANFPLLKVSPDMPSAQIVDTMPFTPAQTPEPCAKEKLAPREFEEIDSHIDGHHNGGNAPFDYDYEGWIRLRDEENNLYQVEALYRRGITIFFVLEQEQKEDEKKTLAKTSEKDPEGLLTEPSQEGADEALRRFWSDPEEMEEEEPLECYSSLEEAAGSEFFRYFLELDKRTDAKVLEVMQKIDDTREYGSRCGMCWREERPQIYMETFNQENPGLREYFQILEYSDGEIHYTASHESCFMQLEMGQENHDFYFGYKRKPEYYLNVDKDSFDTLNRRHRFIFHWMIVELHEYALSHDGFFKPDLSQVQEERLECLIEQGVEAHFSKRNERSLLLLKAAIQILEEMGAPQKSHLAEYLSTCMKIALTLEEMEKPEQMDWWRKIYEQKERTILYGERADKMVDSYLLSITEVAEATWHLYQDCLKKGEEEKAARYLDEAMDLISHHRACEEDWDTQFEIYVAHAAQMEKVNLKLSLVEYQRALAIASYQHLDLLPSRALGVTDLHYRYAQLLWHRCEREEAVLHYARALDLLEVYLHNKTVEEKEVRRSLEQVGEALSQFYLNRGRLKERERLQKRLLEQGIVLKDIED